MRDSGLVKFNVTNTYIKNILLTSIVEDMFAAIQALWWVSTKVVFPGTYYKKVFSARLRVTKW